MGLLKLLLLAATLSSTPAPAPAPADKLEQVAEVARYRFKRMHLVRPDLVTFPAVKPGRTC